MSQVSKSATTSLEQKLDLISADVPAFSRKGFLSDLACVKRQTPEVLILSTEMTPGLALDFGPHTPRVVLSPYITCMRVWRRV